VIAIADRFTLDLGELNILIPGIVLFFIAVPSMGLLYATAEPVCPPQLTVKITGHQ